MLKVNFLKKKNLNNIMIAIKKIVANEIINSLGYPTLQGKLFLDDGRYVTVNISSVDPEESLSVVELRDGDKNRYNGLGVQKAVSYINDLLGPKLVGISPIKQTEVDNWLLKADGTKDKSRLGVNSINLISKLIACSGALVSEKPLYQYLNAKFIESSHLSLELKKLPTPLFTLLTGSRGGQTYLDFKEFLIFPSSAFPYHQSYQISVDLYHNLRKLFKMKFFTNLDALDAIKQSVESMSLHFGQDIFASVNFQAQHYFNQRRYTIKDKEQPLSSEEYIKFIKETIKKYLLLVIIDPLEENDWLSNKNVFEDIKSDFYLSSEKNSLSKQTSTSVLKLNEIGTITEFFSKVSSLKTNNSNFVISAGHAETNDDFVADLSVALQSDFIKFGPPVHSENVTKYNRLLDIEKELKLS
jgi:enolase